MYERILLATDGSEAAVPAIEHAIELAVHTGATLHIVYVVDQSAAAAVPEAQAYSITDLLEEAGNQAMDDVIARVDERDVDYETDIRYGSAPNEIIAAADEADVDLILMGTHGRSGLDRMLLGSVADRVIRSANQPVLVQRGVS